MKVRGREGLFKEENTKLQIWTLERVPCKEGRQISPMLPVSCEIFKQSSCPHEMVAPGGVWFQENAIILREENILARWSRSVTEAGMMMTGCNTRETSRVFFVGSVLVRMTCVTLGKSHPLPAQGPASCPVKLDWGLYNLCLSSLFHKEFLLLSPWSLTGAKTQT